MKNKIASDDLKEFLQDWLNWAEGRESKFNYEEYEGLCVASCSFSDVVHFELNCLFDDLLYPFGESSFRRRFDNDTQHQDPNRLAWVKAALNDTLDTWELME